MTTVKSLELVKDIGSALKSDSKIGESMETIKTVASAAMKTVEVLDETLEIVKHRREIVNRHKEIRELKQEWSDLVYRALEKQKQDVDTMVETTYDYLLKEIEKKQSEIHDWEMKLVIPFLNDPLIPVVRHETHNEARNCGAWLSQLFAKKLTCGKCSSFITDEECIECKGIEFHMACFTCTDCTKNLCETRRVFFIDQQPICSGCGNVRLKAKMESLEEKKLLNFAIKLSKVFNK